MAAARRSMAERKISRGSATVPVEPPLLICSLPMMVALFSSSTQNSSCIRSPRAGIEPATSAAPRILSCGGRVSSRVRRSPSSNAAWMMIAWASPDTPERTQLVQRHQPQRGGLLSTFGRMRRAISSADSCRVPEPIRMANGSASLSDCRPFASAFPRDGRLPPIL